MTSEPDPLLAIEQAGAEALDVEPVELTQDRFSAREVIAEPAEEEPPKQDANSKWSRKPSVKQQMARHPQTVRFGPKQTVVLTLTSKEGDAGTARLNELQKEAHGDAPQIIIGAVSMDFYQGAYTARITYQEIEYQQI